MRTPVTYYGGKQNMVKNILPLIPEHNLYCEPFCGGAAVFFAKENANVNILNDTNRELINFYHILKSDFTSLEKEIQISLYSRDLFRKASVIYNNPDMFSDLKRAWALWILSTQGFAAKLDGTWGYERAKDTTTKKFQNKKGAFTCELAVKLQDTQLECADALYVIHSRDTDQSFFYVDPPYFNSNMGHYDGYSENDFRELLETLSNMKGKFMLSSYPSPALDEFTKREGWHTYRFDATVSVSVRKENPKSKTEVLTLNYAP